MHTEKTYVRQRRRIGNCIKERKREGRVHVSYISETVMICNLRMSTDLGWITEGLLWRESLMCLGVRQIASNVLWKRNGHGSSTYCTLRYSFQGTKIIIIQMGIYIRVYIYIYIYIYIYRERERGRQTDKQTDKKTRTKREVQIKLDG